MDAHHVRTLEMLTLVGSGSELRKERKEYVTQWNDEIAWPTYYADLGCYGGLVLSIKGIGESNDAKNID